MDYKKVYDALMEKRRSNPVPNDEYGERHHIVHRSEGGTDDAENLVRLTAREHYIAHLLLAKIYNDFKMICALHMMRTMKNETTKREFKVNSRLYNSLKIRRSKMMSERMKGHPVSEKTRLLAAERMRRINKGKTPWNKGKSQSDEVKAKLRKANLGKKRSPESIEKFRKSMMGHAVSDETRRKLSEIHKGRIMSDDARRKMSLSHKGKTPPNKGKKASLEVRRKLSEAHKGQIHTEQQRQKMREIMSKLRWWNNGVENRRCEEQPGPEWIKGRKGLNPCLFAGELICVKFTLSRRCQTGAQFCSP